MKWLTVCLVEDLIIVVIDLEVVVKIEVLKDCTMIKCFSFRL